MNWTMNMRHRYRNKYCIKRPKSIFILSSDLQEGHFKIWRSSQGSNLKSLINLNIRLHSVQSCATQKSKSSKIQLSKALTSIKFTSGSAQKEIDKYSGLEGSQSHSLPKPPGGGTVSRRGWSGVADELAKLALLVKRSISWPIRSMTSRLIS